MNPRHLLTVLTAWFGLCWALLEFATFLASRYGVSERWIDAVFTAMWALLPALLLTAWWIGAPGPMHWTRRKRALTTGLIGLGLIVVWQVDRQAGVTADQAAAAGSARSDNALSAPIAPKIALFPFKVDSADAKQAWLGNALPVLGEYDLLYDARLQAISAASSAAPQFLSSLRGYGAADIESASWALRRRAAQSLGYQALVIGSVAPHGERLKLRVELQRLNPDQAMGPYEFEVVDVWEAVDRLAALVREQLSDRQDPRPVNDPALRSISTESLDALKAYVDAAVASQRDGGLAQATAQFAEAVRADPSFVMAELGLQGARYRSGEIQAASRALEAMEPKLGLLPDRFRYRFQAGFATTGGQFERARILYALWAQQLPDDHEPRLGLIRLDLARKPDDPATWRALVELTEQHGSMAELLYLSGAAQRRNQLEDSRALAEVALARDPADVQAKLRLAALERVEGNVGGARRLLDEAWLQRPDLLTTRITLASFQQGDGDWGSALATLADARQRALNNPDVLAQVLDAQVKLLAALGRTRAALAALDELTTLQQARSSPVAFRTWASADIPLRVRGTGEAPVRAWLDALQPIDDAALRSYDAASVDERIAFERRDPPRYRQAIERMRQYWPASFGISAKAGLRLHEALCVAWERNDAAGLKALEKALYAVRNLIVASDDMRLAAIDQALRQGDSLAARRMLAPLLRGQSGDPTMRWRSAQIALLEDDAVQARKHLEPLLAAWAEADADFKPAQQARVLAQRLGITATTAARSR